MNLNEPIPIWENVMIDIETLGTRPGAVISSIAAIGFNIKTGTGNVLFYERISIVQSQSMGLFVDADTVLWWMEKNSTAQDQLKGSDRVQDVMEKFINTIKMNCIEKECKFWANSPSFDFRLLEAVADRVKMRLPWKYYQEMDVRTIGALRPDIVREVREKEKYQATVHTPVTDCTMQIDYVNKIWNEINNASTFTVYTDMKCPKCGMVHVDRDEWSKRLHKKHLCEGCGHIWQPHEGYTFGK